MSDTELDTPDLEVLEDEFTVLKKRAVLLGITVGPNIGLETLRKKVNEKLKEPETAAPEPDNSGKSAKQLKAIARRNAIQDALKLIRVNVSCMNPDKKHLEGDFFTVSNSVIGTETRYVQFNVEDGWHVPNIILTVLKEKQFQTFVTKKLPNGQKTKVGKLVKEYAIEYLDPLTEEELAELARRQAMSGSID